MRERSPAPEEPPVISLVGRSGSGKTTLLEKLIGELKRRGYRVAAIKHHHQHGLQWDKPGKDSWRYAQAGADHVVLAGPEQVVHIQRFADEPTLGAIASRIQGVDVILTEGYKHADAPQIEVLRGQVNLQLVSEPNALVAVATDRPLDIDVPQFDLNEVARLADFLEARFLPPR